MQPLTVISDIKTRSSVVKVGKKGSVAFVVLSAELWNRPLSYPPPTAHPLPGCSLSAHFIIFLSPLFGMSTSPASCLNRGKISSHPTQKRHRAHHEGRAFVTLSVECTLSQLIKCIFTRTHAFLCSYCFLVRKRVAVWQCRDSFLHLQLT